MTTYPNVTVTLTGSDGNAFAILGKVRRALRNAGISSAEIQAYVDEAWSEDYDHLLQVTMETVNVE